MNIKTKIGARLSWASLLVVLAVVPGVHAQTLTVNLVDGIDGTAVEGFRWVLQEDTTYDVDPNNLPLPENLGQQLAGSFHRSHHPIARTESTGAGLQGHAETGSAVIADVPPGRYYLSVLPYSGHAMGGVPVDLRAGGQSVVVEVQRHPIPTTKIAVLLFHDCFPLNGAPDFEEAPGAGNCVPNSVDFSEFDIVVEEPAGRYGIAGGPLLQDAFGNPLGTTYNPDGSVATLGDGTLRPNPDGSLVIKNLAPGKYGIIIIPPTGAGWIQTSTIEGSPVVDAWVKANEPPYFAEVGVPGPHVFFGFTQQHNDLSDVGDGVATISGRITDIHLSRPPLIELFNGRPYPQCWVAINLAVHGQNVYAEPCDANSEFSIADVPPGTYNMKVFDTPLDIVIATQNFTVDPDGGCNGGGPGSCAFGDIGVNSWFHRLSTYIFSDDNQNGFWDTADEPSLGAESGPVNVRWRDGTIYQSFPTDFEGAAPFDETFPFFHWLVAEVGFTNKKATGVTIVADAGGFVDTTQTEFPSYGELTPQPQSENAGQLWRTEVGPVLTQAFQGFAGQTNVIQFGKTDYLVSDFSALPPAYVGENGGISGVVLNTVTRAENNPQMAVAEEWEPGVPRTQVNLYADGDIDSPVIGEAAFSQGGAIGTGDVDWNQNGSYDADNDIIDDVNANGRVDLADVDNYPLDNFPGPEDVNRCATGSNDLSCDEFYDPPLMGTWNYTDGFDRGDAIAVTWSDSWDDNLPTGCQGQNNIAGLADDDCFDGMRNWNQIRPGVFDGGYAFGEYDLADLAAVNPGAAAQIEGFYVYVNAAVAPTVAATLQLGLLPADYIVEATTPPGYQTLREHHRNVDFGDEFQPSPEALPPVCIGPDQIVPPYFAIATMDGSGADGQLIAGIDPADAAAPFAGELRPVCDQKKVPLQAAQNAAADFFLVSNTPVAANITGTINNDLANQFDPNAPNFTEKYSPPYLPVAFYDWTGVEVNRVYADSYGRYNALVPSTWTPNLPQPSGMGPNMLLACMNDAGPIPDPLNPGQMKLDPNFNPAFSQFCYTFQYMPGATTYLDTPVVPVAAFTSPTTFPVDCELPTRTPMISYVTRNPAHGGPGPFVVNQTQAPQEILIYSRGMVSVTNPNWDGTGNTPVNIMRDYGFAFDNSDDVLLIGPDDAETPLATSVVTDANGETVISAQVPVTTPPGDYQVVVRSVEQREAPTGITLTVGVCEGGSSGSACTGTEFGVRQNTNGAPYGASERFAIVRVDDDGADDAGAAHATIQESIDAATAGDLILVAPGSYDELPVMWKPVKLQGWGAEVVLINARQTPGDKILAWRDKVEALVANGSVSLLQGQDAAPAFPAFGADILATEEGAGIFVIGPASGGNLFFPLRNRGARIDGFTVVGASQGGGITVNGHVQWLSIGNNVLTSNSGIYGGGIRVGHPDLVDARNPNNLIYTDALNDRVNIHHNRVVKNGATQGSGGGIALYTGADNYHVHGNWVCGNFALGNGAGIAHMGVSNRAIIQSNDVLFNESFSQANAVHGGGIYIGGQPALQLDPFAARLLSEGTGNVAVNANRIHGNLAGAGDGGGIAIVRANGLDVSQHPTEPGGWYDVSLMNNIITNNVAGTAGAVSIQDSLEVHVVNNTIAHNDSTATAGALPPGNLNRSIAQSAGIVSRVHTVDMADLLFLLDDGSIPPNGGPTRIEAYRTFSDADVHNTIVFANRAFFWDNTTTSLLFPASCDTPPAGAGCDVDTTPFQDYTRDIAVMDGLVDTGDLMFVRFALLTDTIENSPYTHISVDFTLDPMFVNPVFNEGRDGLGVAQLTALQVAGALDEGGNFLQVTFGPLSIVDDPVTPTEFDYHLGSDVSLAIDSGHNVNTVGLLRADFDGDVRPNAGLNDIGADER